MLSTDTIKIMLFDKLQLVAAYSKITYSHLIIYGNEANIGILNKNNTAPIETRGHTASPAEL